jgi:hypothetical protein
MRQMGMTVQLSGWPSVVVVVGQWAAVAVVVAAAVWIARLHRKLLNHYLQLQMLLSDLLGAMNLSLARCAHGAGDEDLRHIERIRAAVQEAVAGIAGKTPVP